MKDSNNEAYPWDTREHLQGRKPYGFVDFNKNPDFFQAYKERRDAHVRDLREKYLVITSTGSTEPQAIQVQLRFPEYQDQKLMELAQQHSSKCNICPKDHFFNSYYPEELEYLQEFDSSRVIETLYESFYEGNFRPMFIKHFRRVLKKVDLRILREGYNHNFINTSKEKPGLESYGLFALTLAFHLNHNVTPERIQSLSTLLKTNDFLMSEKDSLRSPLELISAYTSLRVEDVFIQKIMGERGIQ